MVADAPLLFELHAKMTSDQAITEMYSKTGKSAHPSTSRLAMQAMICIAMAYETVCSTARSVAAAVARAYVPHTFVEYEALIDRAAHAVYIAAAAGGPMLVPDPFVLKLQS